MSKDITKANKQTDLTELSPTALFEKVLSEIMILNKKELMALTNKEIVDALLNSSYSSKHDIINYDRLNKSPLLNNKSLFVKKIFVYALNYEIHAYKFQDFDESTDKVLHGKWIAGENKNAGWEEPDFFAVINMPFFESKL